MGIGSNLGSKADNCLRAIDRVDKMEGSRVRARSTLFRTEPVGVEGQDWYVNCVIRVDAELSAEKMLRGLNSIEGQMGRVRRGRWNSRIIDLDILLYGQQVIDEKGLIIPHKLMHLRRFVLAPMIELAPELIHPVLGKTMVELIKGLSERGQSVMPFGDGICGS